jgi:hypothetical protein
LSHKEILGVRDKGINTSAFTTHSVWVTAKRLKREKGDLLGVTHVITFSLTSGTHLAALANSSNGINLACSLNLINPEQRLSIDPTRKS